MLKEGNRPPFRLTDLTNLKDYQNVSEDDKKRIDELICPIVLDNNSCTDVIKFNKLKSVSIVIDKEDMLNEHHKINEWDDYITSMLSTENEGKPTN